MGFFVDNLLQTYGLKPIEFDKIVDITKLPEKYNYVLSSIFYPYTIINKDYVKYIEYFWSLRVKEKRAFLSLSTSLMSEQYLGNNNVLNYNVKVSIAHFRTIPNIVGVVELIPETGYMMLKEIIIPEYMIMNGNILEYSINYQDFISKFYDSTDIRLNLNIDNNVKYGSNKITLLLTDRSVMSKNLLLPQGHRIGIYTIMKDMISVYLNGKLRLGYTDNKVWRELSLNDITDIGLYGSQIYERIESCLDNTKNSEYISDLLNNLIRNNSINDIDKPSDAKESIKKYCNDALPFGINKCDKIIF